MSKWTKWYDGFETKLADGWVLRVTPGGLGWIATAINPSSGGSNSSCAWETSGAAKRAAGDLHRRAVSA